ncbi:hypothetical protein KVH04_20720, partial [Streptomyces olivaceus]|nr:hypothetical protein [Streptomyces olivaceus]
AGQTHADRVGEARARLDEAERSLREEQRITLDLPETDVPAGRWRTPFGVRGEPRSTGSGRPTRNPRSRARPPAPPARPPAYCAPGRTRPLSYA